MISRKLLTLLPVLLPYLLFIKMVSCAATIQPIRNSTRVIRIYFDSRKHLATLNSLKNDHGLDPWREASLEYGSGDYMLQGHKLNDVLGELHGRGMAYDVLLHDVEGHLEAHNPVHHILRRRRLQGLKNYRYKYLPYHEMIRYLEAVKKHARNVNINVGSIGKSFEGRNTPYVRISRGSEPKPTVFIDGGMHSREWISPAMVNEIIHRLAVNSENDTDVDTLLDRFHWVLVPLVNPDGYQYTFHPGLRRRLWRKSRASNHSSLPECIGVDLNRNFGFQWDDNPKLGGSNDPCSGTYSGPESFSEPESRNLRDLLLQHRDAILSYLTFHSFGQFFLYPWGFSSDASIEDEKDLHAAATTFAASMRKRNYDYFIGGSAKTLYPAAGASDDYARGSVGAKYAFTVELPPQDSADFGFLLPEAEVKDVVTDTWAGLKDYFAHLIDYLKSTDKVGQQKELLDLVKNINNASNQKQLSSLQQTTIHG